MTTIHLQDAGSSRTKEEYKQWVKAHKIMKDSPPAAGWDYLTHANNLLLLLQGIADIHPIAKVVISGFKTVVMFEKDRRDNDVRVTAVFLAQTDTMQVLLDIDDLATRQQDRLDLQSLRSNAMLGSVLERIAKDIKECGNSIDTYYKESRFAKFWKSQEWKDRMLGYVQTFSDHRAHLQQIVSLQVASGVGDLVSKMNDVLSRLYKPKSGWEKELDDRTHRLGNPAKWLNDEPTLRSMVALTDDPTLPIPPLGQENPADFLVKSRLEKVRIELEMSLDIICERNMDRFELRLNFFAYQMQEAIQESTHTIVQALSGPFDRLENEDLRELWKEMDWIFCIDNKLFSSALFEYYLDRFSGRKESGSNVRPRVGSTTRSKFGSINHVDSWTLEYLANHGESITAAIDTDESGFIRISEANAFTRRMPDGWNLPRLCAYSAAGWSLEARIYRKRITHLLSKIIDLQASVAPNHLENVFSCLRFPLLLNVCHGFWREPKASLHQPPISLELKDSVKEKIIHQDTALRSSLDSLKWTIDDVSTIDLLFGDAPLESYILQICAIMLESFLKFVHTSCDPTPLNLSDLNRVVTAFDIMRQISVNRVEDLKVSFEASNPKESFSDYINQYRGGIWSYFNATADYKLPTYIPFLDEYSKDSYSFEEFKDFVSDLSILDDFPPPALPEVASRSFKETRITIPESRMKDFETPMMMDEYIYGFPPTAWYCNLCNKIPLAEQRYHCIECFDMDLCEECFSLPKDKCVVEDHRFGHPVIVFTLDILGQQIRILEEGAAYSLDSFQYFLRSRERSSADSAKKSSTKDENAEDSSKGTDQPAIQEPVPEDILFACGSCSDGITADSLFYKCLGHACKEFYICAKCGASKEDVEGSQHKWWHNLVTLRRDIIEHESQRRKPLDETPDSTNNTNGDRAEQEKGSDGPPHDSIVSAINSMVDEKMANLENNMKTHNAGLDERMTRLEAKMDNLIMELKGWLSNGRNP